MPHLHCHHPIYDFQVLSKTLRCCYCPEVEVVELGMQDRKRSVIKHRELPQPWDPSYVQYRPSF